MTNNVSCNQCFANDLADLEDSFIWKYKKSSIKKVLDLLVRNAFRPSEVEELSIPAIEIKVNKKQLFEESERLSLVLRQNGIIVRPHKERNEVWAPSVEAVYEVATDEVHLYLYGVDDEILAGTK